MSRIILSEIATGPPAGVDENEMEKEADDFREEIEDLQEVMRAQSKYSLLVVMQGMDASGKDSAISKVFSKVAPGGIQVRAFKRPTDLEMSHDFLWRVHQHVPSKGMIQVFNRSHYEDVLIQRVHRWVSEETVYRRFDHINNFEKLLQDNHTTVIKFYLHISKEQQLKELDERKTDPEKHYKHNENDYKEREHWDDYMKAYEDVFLHCSPEIPWHIIPSDENWYKEYCMSKVILEAMRKMDLSYPPLRGFV
jgi:PPK2 family polyphosphate:nucleotide phosphotransferase